MAILQQGNFELSPSSGESEQKICSGSLSYETSKNGWRGESAGLANPVPIA